MNTRRERLAELLYPSPRAFDTVEQFTRDTHDDIGAMSLEQLDDERLLARLARALTRTPSPWLRERLARLETEAARRRQRPANVAR